MLHIPVEEQRWLGEKRFLQALNYRRLLTGPEAPKAGRGNYQD
jgi:chromate transporter